MQGQGHRRVRGSQGGSGRLGQAVRAMGHFPWTPALHRDYVHVPESVSQVSERGSMQAS